MDKQSHFLLRNESSRPLVLNIEPEGAFVPLNGGEEVSVRDTFLNDPVTLKVSISDKEGPIISIWPGDGEVKVEKGGVDVLDFM